MERREFRLGLLAGWLFADLFLVLFLIGLSATPGAESARPPSTPPSTMPPSSIASTTPSTAATSVPSADRVLDRDSVEFQIPVELDRLAAENYTGPTARDLVEKVSREVEQRRPGAEVGFVLVFAAGPIDGVNIAIERAGRILQELKLVAPRFSGAVGEPLWAGGADAVEFKVFYYG